MKHLTQHARGSHTQSPPARIGRIAAAVAPIVLALAVTRPASAAIATFNTASGNYATATNWSTGTIPGNGNNDEPRIGVGNTQVATYNNATNYTTNVRMIAGSGASGNGTLTMSGSAGTLTFTGSNYIGVDGATGALNVNAGTITFNDTAANHALRVGANAAGASGTVTVGGGTLNAGKIAVGRGNFGAAVTGVVTVNSGSLTGTTLYLTYDGDLNFANPGGGASGGTAGTATFNLNGGTATLNQIVRFDTLNTGSGIFNFNGGTLKAGASSATYMQGLTRANVRNGGAKIDTNGFDIAIGQALLHSNIGGDAAADGGLAKSGNGALTLTGANTFTGASTVSAGSLIFSGAGASTGGGNMLVATASGNRATLNFDGTGTRSYAAVFNVGGSSGSGAVVQTGGTTNFTHSSSAYIEMGNGGYGSYTLAGGILNTNNLTGIRVGGATTPGGVGVFTQTGGTANLQRFLAIGNANSTGVATFTGGTLNIDTSGNNRGILVGDSGAAVMNLGTAAGGNASIVSSDTNGVRVGGSGSGVLNLNSGTLQIAGAIKKNSTGPSALNLNGATVKAGANGLTLIDNTIDAIRVYNGGLVVDTNGFNSIVSANLANAAGSGLYTAGGVLAVGSGGAGYLGAPIVTVTGGSGSGAMAVANVSGGVITGVTLTNPGQNYQIGDLLSFAFTGGGFTSAAPTFNYALTAADLADNDAGGVTKLGAGTLTLTGVNSYLGDTTITAGVLSIGAAYLADASTVSVASGSAFNLNFGGVDWVGSLVLGGVTQTAGGTYGAVGSGALHQSAYFAGSGMLQFAAVIPSPAALPAGLTLLALASLRRRR